MYGVEELGRALQAIGFSCRMCGGCCRGEEDEGRVIVSPIEIDGLASATGMEREEMVKPYPEFIESGDGHSFTFEWCIRRSGSGCIFHSENGSCLVYAVRPWICRTYPFALDGEQLTVSECPGTGGEMTEEAAGALANALILRKRAEEEEEDAVLKLYAAATLPDDGPVVFDSRGMWRIHG
ncbi:MAG: YkgJ family cysteine cluster protein [Methanocalculus sp. MSAO_Arc1]|uniref:YkgJ family cysteine cluster protein n=1 Tax=Methanocalculus TaxID=71151 RepID=UPI000FF780F1|nr:MULTISPECIES: YkgJ family cysteine cluster protein [unclassified Methanocalculus]MCP1663067.1 Fe-S-cluster containining protein [Methanocalculus sp. AMF5]RQD81743.1 MAG: YkgJ family cysteine cluster protein [Methanocalculus sp. MSAO_Arc1]